MVHFSEDFLVDVTRVFFFDALVDSLKLEAISFLGKGLAECHTLDLLVKEANIVLLSRFLGVPAQGRKLNHDELSKVIEDYLDIAHLFIDYLR